MRDAAELEQPRTPDKSVATSASECAGGALLHRLLPELSVIIREVAAASLARDEGAQSRQKAAFVLETLNTALLAKPEMDRDAAS